MMDRYCRRCGEWINPGIERPKATMHENVDECIENLLGKITDLEKRIQLLEWKQDE